MTDSITESINKHNGAPSTSTSNLFGSDSSSIRYDTDHGQIDVNRARVTNTIRSIFEDTTRFDDLLPEIWLPGSESMRGDCGDPIPRFCSDCGHVDMVGRTCYRAGCPRCWKGHNRKRSTTICSKLEALRRYKEASGSGWQGYKFHHVVISPPEGFAVDSDDPLQRTFDLMKTILTELGAETGVLFYHPFRGDNGDDRGFWKNVLPDGSSNWDEMREQLSFEPHFHAVVLSKYVAGGDVTKYIEEETGFVIERITKGEDSDVSIYNQWDLARSVSYCLSHTGIQNKRMAYRYFGEVANFTATEDIERQMDAAVRSVVPNTLGLAYDDLACTTERTETSIEVSSDEKVNVDAAHAPGSASASSSTSSSSTTELDHEEPAVETETTTCDGRLLDIKNAPAFLQDADWVGRADHVDELRDAWNEWRQKIDGSPEWTPPD